MTFDDLKMLRDKSYIRSMCVKSQIKKSNLAMISTATMDKSGDEYSVFGKLPQTSGCWFIQSSTLDLKSG